MVAAIQNGSSICRQTEENEAAAARVAKVPAACCRLGLAEGLLVVLCVVGCLGGDVVVGNLG